MMRSCESSSIGIVTNLDCPMRMMEVMINIDSARSALVDSTSEETSEKRRVSFVSVAARTDPV